MMLSSVDISEQIKAEKKQKRVSWVDGQTDGKVNKKCLITGVAATLKEDLLDDEIFQLMNQGYTEEEASSIVGKPVTPTGKNLYLDPMFYDSKEKIDTNKAEAKAAEQARVNRENRHAFFKDVGFIAIATTATLALFRVMR